MGREKQIEEMVEKMQKCYEKNGLLNFKWFAEALYNAGYRKTFTSDFASDTQKAYKEGYEKSIEETKAENEILKIQNKNLEIAFDRLEAENERLTERLKQVLLSIDTVKEMNAMCNIDEQKKQAVKEFAEKLKKRSYCDNNFMDGKWHRYVFVDEIDELLKEYEQ